MRHRAMAFPVPRPSRFAVFYRPMTSPRQMNESGGDIQATTKVVDSRSLKSSPPEIFRQTVFFR
jgi:hypothetical protein